MRPKWFSGLLVCLCLALLATSATAQEFRGRINGTVTDNSGAVLPGVTVSAASPALMRPQSTVTGEDGTYRLIALPAGVYDVTFELAGFQTVRREGIRVVINTTLTVDISLNVATLEETVTVTGESPVVDTSTTTVGTVFTKELLTEIPGARDIWAAMAQAPGFAMTGYDVGGSHAGTQTGFSTYGLSEQRTTRIEGINTTENTSANAGYFDFGSFEEFQLGAAGNGADHDTPGASLNITVKAGGDRFGGMWYSDWQGKDLISDNVPEEFGTPSGKRGDFKAPAAAGVTRGNQIDRQYDINGNVGGPVYKGKAWFFFSYRLNDQYTFITGAGDQLAQSKLTNYTVKGTYQLSRGNQLIGYWNRREKLQPLRDFSLSTPVSAAFYQASRNFPFKGEWTSVISDNLFLDVIVADWRNYFPLRPTAEAGLFSGTLVPGRIDCSTNQYFDGGSAGPSCTATGGGSYQDQARKKPQYLATLSYFKDGWHGSHDFKFGAEGRWEERVFFQDQPFNIFYRDNAGAVDRVDLFNTPTAGDNRVTNHSVYVQDGWRFNDRLTLNLGLRGDYYRDFFPDQAIAPEGIPVLANATDQRIRDFFARKDIPGREVAQSFTVAPRAGFAYDVRGNGKTVVKAFFGQFYFNSAPDTLAALENPNGTARLQYRFNDLNGNRILDGEHELGAFVQTFGGAGFVRIDRDLKRPYSLEASAHIEREVFEGLSARASYVYKNIRNQWDEVDLLRSVAYTIPVVFNDPGADNVAGTSDDQRVELLDRTAGIGSDRVITNPDGDDADYNTIEFAVNRRLRNKWMLLSGFGYTWLKQFHGISSSTSALTAGGIDEDFRWRPNERRWGRETSTGWGYKLLGRYIFPLDIGFSGTYRLQSGRNYGRTASVGSAVLRNAGTETVRVEPIDARRFPHVHLLDIRVDKSFTLPNKMGKLTALMDVFNLANANPVTNARIVTGTRFNEVIALLDPRIVRFGVRFEF